MSKAKKSEPGGGRPAATLGTIAASAGVSRATVSRALSDNPVISAPVRRRIKALARKLGYRPDPEVARLLGYLKRSRRQRFDSVIAVLNAYRPPEAMARDAYTARLLAGARSRSEALGFGMETMALHADGMTARRFDHILKARGVRGVLVPPEPEPLFNADLDWTRLAAVATTTTARPLGLHRVLPDNFANLRLLIEAALAREYRRIGLVWWAALEERQLRAPTAVYTWHAKVARDLVGLPLFEWRWREPEAMAKGLATWMKRHRPELVLAPADAVRRTIEKASGAKAPVDYGFVSYGEDLPGVSRLDQRPEAVGAAAVDLLSALVHRGESGLPATPQTTLIAGSFVEDRTTRAARNAAG
jgi:DNA-binding LacI/PurR family transcriptional regulator